MCPIEATQLGQVVQSDDEQLQLDLVTMKTARPGTSERRGAVSW